MGEYKLLLDDEAENFLDLYLTIFPLREGHTREMYPGLIANNFINSMMKRKHEFLGIYKDKYGKEYKQGGVISQP